MTKSGTGSLNFKKPSILIVDYLKIRICFEIRYSDFGFASIQVGLFDLD